MSKIIDGMNHEKIISHKVPKLNVGRFRLNNNNVFDYLLYRKKSDHVSVTTQRTLETKICALFTFGIHTDIIHIHILRVSANHPTIMSLFNDYSILMTNAILSLFLLHQVHIDISLLSIMQILRDISYN